MVVDPHNNKADQATMLMEVSRNHFKVREMQTSLLMQLSSAAVAGIRSVQTAGLAEASTQFAEQNDTEIFLETSFGNSEATEIFLETTFGNSEAGYDNMMKYP